MVKRVKPSDEELNKLSHEEFVVWFMEWNKQIIDRYITRRLIKNRYDPTDIRAYMAERMLDILGKRLEKGRPIKNPRTYFGKLIDFWCIEYQRMHGYIYGMPKRPRNVEAEEEIAKHGFVYLETASTSKNTNGFEESPQLAYVDINLYSASNPETYTLMGYGVKGQDPDQASKPWESMMAMVLPEDRPVLYCLFKMNMSIPEASRHLNIAVCTAYNRRDRALSSISGHLVSGLNVDQKSWRVLDDVMSLKPSTTDISDLFRDS